MFNLLGISSCKPLWASYQIRKIAGCECAWNVGSVFPAPRVSDPDIHHGTCVTYVPWCMAGSLTSGFRWNRPMETTTRVPFILFKYLLLMHSWWRHQMETFFALLDLCGPVTGESHSQRPLTQSFDASFDLRLHKRLSKQSRRRWFETPSPSLWRNRNG